MGKLEQQLALPRRGFYVDAPVKELTIDPRVVMPQAAFETKPPLDETKPSGDETKPSRCGRPKKYANDADRLRAYRARKAEK